MIPSVQVLTSTAYTNTLTTASNVGGLSMFLTAGGLYRFHGAGQYSVSTVTSGPTIGMMLAGDGNLSATWFAQRWTIQSNAGAVSGTSSTAAYTILGPAPLGVAPNVASTQYAWECSGLIRVSIAGSISMQAQRVNATATTLTIGTGSVLLIEQLA
jgi:hypothetical protein